MFHQSYFKNIWDFNNLMKNIINFPLIIISSVMGLINSNFEPEKIKYMNITWNCFTAFILALINNFKLDLKAQTFHNLSLKMNRLTHSIENDLNDNMEQLTQENIETYINDYDNINEILEFGLIQFIKNNVKNQYKIKRVLPNSLNCELSFIENNS